MISKVNKELLRFESLMGIDNNKDSRVRPCRVQKDLYYKDSSTLSDLLVTSGNISE